MFKGAILFGTFGAFPGMNATQLHDTAGALQPLAFSAETSDNVSAVVVELLDNLNAASGPDFKGVRIGRQPIRSRSNGFCVIR